MITRRSPNLYWWGWCLTVPLVALTLAWTTRNLSYMQSGHAPTFTNSCCIIGCLFAICGMYVAMCSSTAKAFTITTCITGCMLLLPKTIFQLTRTDLNGNNLSAFSILAFLMVSIFVIGCLGYSSGTRENQIPPKDTVGPLLACACIALFPFFFTLS